jgi:CspA family cold shock protein
MMIKKLIQRLKGLFCKTSCSTRFNGAIKFFDRKKRFGFIISDDNEYFFHAAATKPNDFKLLQDGRAVTFVVTQGKKGPQADKIEIVR